MVRNTKLPLPKTNLFHLRKTVENISSADFRQINMVTLHNSIFNRNCCHAWDTFATFSQFRNRKPAKSIQLASLALNWLQSVWEKTTNFDWLKVNLTSVKLKKRALLVLKKAAFESCSWPFCQNTTVSCRVKYLRGFLQSLAAWISNILPKILRTGDLRQKNR